jgi:hypothetical protein
VDVSRPHWRSRRTLRAAEHEKLHRDPESIAEMARILRQHAHERFRRPACISARRFGRLHFLSNLGGEPPHCRVEPFANLAKRSAGESRSLLTVAVDSVFSRRAADEGRTGRPQRNGISKETGLLAQWPGRGPKLPQVHEIGDDGDPAVEFLYLISNKGMTTSSCRLFSSRCKAVWTTRRKSRCHTDRNIPVRADAVDGDAIYLLT